ncbi:MAG: cytochrome c oxidase subunit 3, partial [Spirochaetota bacterium]|nr:cytochrome c oxidase subunit 3 [Spirochaetota bacterium]
PKGRLAVWLVVGGELVIFGGGVMAFLLERFRFLDTFDSLAALTNTPLGALNTVVLLTSSFFVVMAHNYAAKKDHKKMGKFLLLTIVMGTVFLLVKSYEWGVEKIPYGVVLGNLKPAFQEAFGPGQIFWSYYYFLTGMHAVHVVLGMLVIFIVYMNTRQGTNLHRVEMIGIYWHFVDLVWIFLFPIFYLSR